jgi:hypothetical protein
MTARAAASILYFSPFPRDAGRVMGRSTPASRRLFRSFAGWWLIGISIAPALAHDLTITQVLASFDRPGIVDVKIDIDLTSLLPSPEAYYGLAVSAADVQRRAIEALLPQVVDGLRVTIGQDRLHLIFQDYKLPALSPADFLDPTTDHFTFLHFIAVLPASRKPIRLVVPPKAKVSYPIAFIVQIPSAHFSQASWLGDESEESDLFDWAAAAPKAGAAR